MEKGRRGAEKWRKKLKNIWIYLVFIKYLQCKNKKKDFLSIVAKFQIMLALADSILEIDLSQNLT